MKNTIIILLLLGLTLSARPIKPIKDKTAKVTVAVQTRPAPPSIAITNTRVSPNMTIIINATNYTTYIYRCRNRLVDLSFRTTPGNAIRVYKDPTGNTNPVIVFGKPVDTGGDPNPDAVSIGGYYADGSMFYAESYNIATGAVSARRTAVQIKEVNMNFPALLPTLEKFDDDTDGIQTFDLTKNIRMLFFLAVGLSEKDAPNYTVDFYTDAALTKPINTPKAFVNTTPNKQKIYYKIVHRYIFFRPCEKTGAFDVVVKNHPNSVTVNSVERCGPGPVRITATSTSGNPIGWYESPTSTRPLFIGSPFVSIINKTKDLYVSDCLGCTRKKVTITIQAPPAPPTVNAPIVYSCSPGLGLYRIDFRTTNGNAIRVYRDPTGNTPVLIGGRPADSANKTLTGDTTHLRILGYAGVPTSHYYAESYNVTTGCVSETRTTVQLVNVNIDLPKNIPNITKCDNNADGIETFDLTQNNNILLQGKKTADYTIDFYTDAGLSQTIATPKTFNNTTPNRQNVYFKISFKNSRSTCFRSGHFQVIVPTIISKNVSQYYCDDDEDLHVIIDLNTP